MPLKSLTSFSRLRKKAASLAWLYFNASITTLIWSSSSTQGWHATPGKNAKSHAAPFWVGCAGPPCSFFQHLFIRRHSGPWFRGCPQNKVPSLPFADFRLTPHYPAKSPLDDLLRYVEPGSDEYVTEKYAAEIARHLEEWGQELRSGPSPLNVLAKFLDASLKAASLVPAQEKKLRSGDGVDVFRRTFSNQAVLGRERFLEEVRNSLAPLGRLRTAEFQIAGIEQTADSPLNVRIDIRYDLVGQHGDTRTRGAHRLLADGMDAR